MREQLYHPTLLLKRLGIVLLVYELCRVLFIVFNAQVFPSLGFADVFPLLFHGIRFDISAIVYTNALFIVLHLIPVPQRDNRWYQIVLKVLFYVVNSIALFVALIDLEYFKYSLRRSSFDITGYYFDFTNALPQFLKDFWYLLLIFIAVLVFMEFLFRRTNRNNPRVRPRYWLQAGFFVAAVPLLVIAARGGLQRIPLSPINAVHAYGVGLAPIITNTPFQILYSVNQRNFGFHTYFEPAVLSTHLTRCARDHALPVDTARGQDNVLIIIMESISQEVSTVYNPKAEMHAPFLDSLAREALVFKRMFSNGTRSVEGIPAICASIPHLMDNSFINSVYQSNQIDGIGTLLKRVGYATAFFHGGNNGTFNFDSFAKLAGFRDYYGRNEYGDDKDFDGNWGIYDEPFFQYTAEKLNEYGEPFCGVLYSLSSHHPFTIPKSYEGIIEEKDPYFRSVEYADHALRKFFLKASRMPWFNNTLFVITADHKGPTKEPNSHNSIGIHSIPLIIYKPGSDLQGEVEHPAQQIDILPTVLDYLNYPHAYCSFGKSLFDSSDRYVYSFLYNTYQILSDSFMLQFDGNRSIALYNHVEDMSLGRNLLGTNRPKQLRLENRLKAVIQGYYEALKNNTLSAQRAASERPPVSGSMPQ